MESSTGKRVHAFAEMLIRKPVNEVFDAFVKPETIQKFWLEATSGPRARNATVNWEFMVEGAHETVTVTTFTENRLIAFTWSDGISVEMSFELTDQISTRLSVTAKGFHGADAQSQVVNATEGFSIVLCDLKSHLESGHSGNMVRDKAALLTAKNAQQ